MSSTIDLLIKATSKALESGSRPNLTSLTSAASKLNRKECHAADVRDAFWAADGPAPAILTALAAAHGFLSKPAAEAPPTTAELPSKTHAMLTAAHAEVERRRAESTAKGNTGRYWAAGVGYGHDDSEDYDYDWDTPKTTAQSSVRSAAVLDAQSKLRTATEAVLRILVVMLETDTAGATPPSTAVDVLVASPFAAVLKSLLREGDHLAGSNPKLFRNTVRCLRLFAHVPALVSLLDVTDETDSESLRSLLKELALDVEAALELDAAAVSGDAAGAGGETADTNPLAPFNDYIQKTMEMVDATATEEVTTTTTTTTTTTVTDVTASTEESETKIEVATTTTEPSTTTDDEETKGDDTTAATSKPTKAPAVSLESLTAAYEAALTKHQFGASQIVKDAGAPGPKHHYASSLETDKSHKLPKILRELRSMRRALPLHPGAAVFVRYDKRRPMVMQALVSGPAGTPYDSGLFLFDMYCPPSYPSSPPKVNLMTTGGGSVRFNPNLYANGKVCLSLLGTWEGSSAESWTVDSTLLQVWLSIQALILVPEPYWNEPGVERSMHSESSKRANRHDSNGGFEPLRHHTLKWAVADMIKNPPAGFEDVVKAHFAVKADYIRGVMAEWMDDVTETKEKLEAAIAEVEEALATVEEKKADAPAVVAGAGVPPAPELARATSA